MSRRVERAEFERLRTDNLLNKRLLIDLPKGGLDLIGSHNLWEFNRLLVTL